MHVHADLVLRRATSAHGLRSAMRFVLAAALATCSCRHLLRLRQPAPVPPPAQAYFEFLLARRLESQGDTAGALAALKRAQALDPKSAEILAELAGFHARQNEGPEAIDAAERALKIDPNNLEAHRMLGLVFAALSEAGGPPVPGPHAGSRCDRRRSIT